VRTAVLCEYEETMQRLRAAHVRATVMFFGSARSKDYDQHRKAVEKAQARLAAAEAGSEEASAATAQLSRLESIKWMCARIRAPCARRLCIGYGRPAAAAAAVADRARLAAATRTRGCAWVCVRVRRCEYMEKIRELSRKITQWSVDGATRHLEVVSGVARVARLKRSREESQTPVRN
jgi:hypothetical protein